MLKWKHTQTRLSDNKFCVAIITNKLRKDLEDSSLPPSPPSFSNKPYPGLHSEQIVTYINQTLVTYGVLGSISLKALDLFCQNLAGMTIHTIRYYRSISEDTINNLDLYYENVVQFKRLLDSLHYKGPVFSLVIVALIPTGNDSAKKILAFHQKLIDIAADFKLPIISIRSDGAAAEFQTQNLQVDR
ncbi:hypothetical protein GLOIN_2v1782856 [Rhizophagus irregularis DAOM 181602=DAOM 197198]|nr:hypothetical protein GLOIN_2v1782856 [Rhizophagus irregularis DAOM 181602=DAOM 197198]